MKFNIESKNTTHLYKREEGCVSWASPSNIALVKYWGKWGIQMPRNPSLSFTLRQACTETQLQYRRSEQAGMSQLEFQFEGKANPNFQSRIEKFLASLHTEFPFLKDFSLTISSSNSFPHSTGIASSASAMSALSLCLVSMEEEVMGRKLEKDEFFRKASHVARLGSGSAARSVYGGFVAWGKSDADPNTGDEFAVPVKSAIHPQFQDLEDAIMVIDAGPKKVSSSVGHSLMNHHPYAEARFQQAHGNFGTLLNVLREGSWDAFVELVENEAMSLHALMMNSTPSYTLLHPNTLIGIEKIRQFREQEGVKICFTLDAGPNLHLLYPASEKEAVRRFIEREMLPLLDNNNKWLADGIGEGPKKLI